jgi:hypothetical protein
MVIAVPLRARARGVEDDDGANEAEPRLVDAPLTQLLSVRPPRRGGPTPDALASAPATTAVAVGCNHPDGLDVDALRIPPRVRR